tara:strand:+ start:514 stop:1023 length:510 start_codon:yes stop_codon:yes gene_type:complete
MGESIEDLLRSDPHVVSIESEGTWNYKEVNPFLFKERTDWAKDYIEDLWRFLDRPYIVDDFGDHAIRTKWKHIDVKELYGQDAVDFLQSNALRTMNYAFVNGCLIDVINIDNYCGTNPDGFEDSVSKVRSSCDKLIDDKSDSTPIELVKDFKQDIYNLLDFLSYQSPDF